MIHLRLGKRKCKRYIMQRINTDTFKNPKELMENVCHVTGFLRKVILERGGDPERETLNVIPTKEGKPFYTDSDGGTWRAYIFVEDTVCLQKVENENDFYTCSGNFRHVPESAGRISCCYAA